MSSAYDNQQGPQALTPQQIVCYRPIANVQDCEQLQKDMDHLTS